jgi:hypothetical protein
MLAFTLGFMLLAGVLLLNFASKTVVSETDSSKSRQRGLLGQLRILNNRSIPEGDTLESELSFLETLHQS